MNEQEQVCLMVKCLHEATWDGADCYEIQDSWFKQLDLAFLDMLVRKELLIVEQQTIRFTPKGKAFMDNRYSLEAAIVPNKIYSYLKQEVRLLTAIFNEMKD